MAVFWPLPFGMLAVTRMLLGVSIGEQDRRSLIDVNKIVLIKCFVIQIGLTCLIMLMSTPLTLMFYRDSLDPVYQMTLTGFRMMPLCMPLAVISLHFAGYGQAMQDKYLSNVLPIVDGAVGVVACSFILIPVMKITGLYLSNILNGFICAAVVLVYVVVRNKHFPRTMEEFLLIPDGFGTTQDERIDISIKDMQDVTSLSEQAVEFCKSKNIDRRRAFFTGLALEEMGRNVIEHGFSQDEHKHEIDVRIVHKDNDIILRIKDNCMAFDPLSRAAILDNSSKEQNFGIRIVTGIAKEVQYQNLLGLNVLTIRI